MTKSENYKKWKWMAPLGLLLIGMGFSLTGEAIIWKSEEVYWLHWVSLGTLGLVIFNTGLSVFGKAVIHRVWFEWENKQK